jgi:hypothetical protein
MCLDTISTTEKIENLKIELANHFHHIGFLKAKTMGQIVKIQLKQILLKKLKLVPKTKMQYGD